MPRRKAKGGERFSVGAGVRLALPLLAVLLAAAACGGDEPSEPSPTAPVLQGSVDRWVSYEEAEQLVGFPIQLPAYLPYGLQQQEDVRVVGRGGSNFTVQIYFRNSRPTESKIEISLAEHRERKTGCIGPLTGLPDVVQGAPAAWGGGPGFYLDWARDGLCFTMQASGSGNLTRWDFVEIANSVTGPPVPSPAWALAPAVTPHVPVELSRPPEAVELWEMNLSEAEVSQVMAVQDMAAPDFHVTNTLGWFLPRHDPQYLQGDVRSFVRLHRYERAGLLAMAWNLYTPSPGASDGPGWPQEIMSAIAEYENSEGAEEALTLGARLYGVSYCCSILSEAVRAGDDISETIELTGLGEGARADLITDSAFGQIAAVSVRVDNHIGTIIVRYAGDATDVLSHAKALAAALAEKLAGAR